MLNIITNRDGEISCEIAGLRIKMLIDSGSAVNAITESQFQTMMQYEKHRDQISNIRGDSGASLKAFAQSDSLEVIATFEAKLWISDSRPSESENFYVIKNATRALIGRDTTIRHKILLVGLDVPIESPEQKFQEKVCLHIAAVEKGGEFPKFAMLNRSRLTSTRQCYQDGAGTAI